MSEVEELIRRLEKKFGKGPTYDTSTMRDILAGVYPEWIARGRVLLDEAGRARCDKAIEALKRLHKDVHTTIELRSKPT